MTTTATPPRPSALRGPDRTAEAITGTGHLSWSRISTYQRCPRQFAARYVEHLQPDFRSSSMLFGSGVHAGVELHHLARLAGMSASPEEMLLAYEQAWADDVDADVPVRYPKGDSQEKLQDLAGRVFDRFLDSPLSRPAGELIAVEETLTGLVDETLPTFVARVDLVTVEAEAVRLIDLKTSKASWDALKAAENAQQLALYKVLAAGTLASGGQSIQADFHVLTRHANPRAEIVHAELAESVVGATLAAARSAWAGIQAGDFDPAPNFLCRACAHRSSCPAFGG